MYRTYHSLAYNLIVYYHYPTVYNKETVTGEEILRVCPRAVVLHAILPISMKLCQFKGSTPKLKKD